MSAGSDETRKNPAGSVRVLDVGERDASRQTVKELEAMLEEARRGEVTGFFGVVFQPGRRYHTRGTGGIGRLEAAGALLDAAIAQLGYATRDS